MSSPAAKPAAIRSQRIYRGPILAIREDTFSLPDGHEATAEIVEHPSSVCVAPVLADGTVMMVRQYRKAAQRFLLEAPAGKMEPGEQPEAAVLRELQEEIGHTAGQVLSLGSFYMQPAWCTQRIHAYLASDLTAARLSADEDEFIEVCRVPLTDIPGLLTDGTIRDAKSIATLLLAMRVLGDN